MTWFPQIRPSLDPYSASGAADARAAAQSVRARWVPRARTQASTSPCGAAPHRPGEDVLPAGRDLACHFGMELIAEGGGLEVFHQDR